jgi:hypothetical protein
MTKTNVKLNSGTCTFCRKEKEIHSWLKIAFDKRGIIQGYTLWLAEKNHTSHIKKPHAFVCTDCLEPFHKLFDADIYGK